MIYFKHLIRWVKNFFLFPLQTSTLLVKDVKKDYFSKIYSDTNLVIVIGLPKSGTTFIEEILNLIGYVDITVSPLRIFDNKFINVNNEISEEIFKYAPKKKFSFIKVHSPYSDNLIKIISKYKLKVILSKRLLADALISRYCHVLSEKSHRHHQLIKDLNYEEGFKKSLIIKNSYDTPISPLDYFNTWLENWNHQIKKKKLDFLILNYENIKNKKEYVNSILKYLNLENCNLNQIIKKSDMEFKKNKNLSLEKNLNRFLKPKTFNKDSAHVKKNLDLDNINKFIKENINSNLI